MTELVLETARQALQLGYCPVPTKDDGTKRPDGTWKQRQTVRPTELQLEADFTGRHGIGLVCGHVSGGLEMFEFEARAVQAGITDQYTTALHDVGHGELWDRIITGYLERTPSGGIHTLWRCETTEGNLRLAADPDGQVLIETRGEGGYVIIAPSNGTTHPTGQPWELTTGGLTTIATITPDERAALLQVARTFDQTPPPPPPAPTTPNTTGDGDRPGDQYNRTNTCAQILEQAGWTFHHQDQQGQHWTRPGKTPREGTSACIYTATGTCTLFSTSIDAPPEYLDGHHQLDPWRLHVALNHQGNYSQAARDWRADHPHTPTTTSQTGDNGQAEVDTWDPVDLAPILDDIIQGTVTRPTPQIGHIDNHDGPGLLVQGKVNGFHGGASTGKTMTAEIIACQELAAGNTVWFLDFEDDPIAVVMRFIDLGIDHHTIRTQLRYRRPDQILSLEQHAKLQAELESDQPTLVIVDSTGEWMGLHNVEDKDVHVARFMNTCMRPLASTGAAVLLIDHVPHAEKDRLAPIGSIRKINAVNGCQYLITTLAEMARGRIGKARLTVAKDRTGTRPKSSIAAEILVDSTGDTIIATITPPSTDTATNQGPLAGLPPAAQRVHTVLDPDIPKSTSTIGDLVAEDKTTGLGLKARTIQDALKRLEDAGLAIRSGLPGLPELWSSTSPTSPQGENTL